MQLKDQRSMVASLAAKYPIFAESTIQRWVTQESDKYESARIQKYVPVLVQRSVDATLNELARPDGTSSDLLPTTDDRLERVAVHTAAG